MNRVDNGLVERAAHVHQDAVDIEYHEFWRKLHSIPSMARRSLRVSALVPALMRTKPSRGNLSVRGRRIPFRPRAFTRRCAADQNPTARNSRRSDKFLRPAASSPFPGARDSAKLRACNFSQNRLSPTAASRATKAACSRIRRTRASHRRKEFRPSE